MKGKEYKRLSVALLQKERVLHILRVFSVVVVDDDERRFAGPKVNRLVAN